MYLKWWRKSSLTSWKGNFQSAENDPENLWAEGLRVRARVWKKASRAEKTIMSLFLFTHLCEGMCCVGSKNMGVLVSLLDQTLIGQACCVSVNLSISFWSCFFSPPFSSKALQINHSRRSHNSLMPHLSMELGCALWSFRQLEDSEKMTEYVRTQITKEEGVSTRHHFPNRRSTITWDSFGVQQGDPVLQSVHSLWRLRPATLNATMTSVLNKASLETSQNYGSISRTRFFVVWLLTPEKKIIKVRRS